MKRFQKNIESTSKITWIKKKNTLLFLKEMMILTQQKEWIITEGEKEDYLH